MRRAWFVIVALAGCRQVFGIDEPLPGGGNPGIDAARSDGRGILFDGAMQMPGLAMYVQDGASLWVNDQPPDLAWQQTNNMLAKASVWTGADPMLGDLLIEGLIDGQHPFSVWMEGQISAVKGSLVGVYAANDGTGGGAIAALKAGGVKPLPPVTGQDSELAAIQRILAGDQAMTIYKPVPPEAEAAAKAAIALANKQKPASTGDTDGVPSTILDPIAVTKDKVKDTIIKDNVYKVADICTGAFAAVCTAAGIS